MARQVCFSSLKHVSHLFRGCGTSQSGTKPSQLKLICFKPYLDLTHFTLGGGGDVIIARLSLGFYGLHMDVSRKTMLYFTFYNMTPSNNHR